MGHGPPAGVRAAGRQHVSAEQRTTAIDRILALRRLLGAQPNAADLAPLVEECGHLLSAVQAFHMEAIRFRMYGLTRQLTRLDPAAPREVAALLDEARTALEAAGFRTK